MRRKRTTSPAPPSLPLVSTAPKTVSSAGATEWSIGFGQTMHSRLAPVRNRFVYRSFFIQGELPHGSHGAAGNWLFGINRRALLSFNATDHGPVIPIGERRPPLLEWLQTLLREAGLPCAHRIRYRGFARVMGYAFKPVSFWFCENDAGQRYAIVAEVHNTFGERHFYLLHTDSGRIGNGQPLFAQKEFHVSPFLPLQGKYEFRFLDKPGRCVVRIDYVDQDRLVLQTSLSASWQPIVAKSVWQALLGYPLFSIGVIAKVHWQALKLWRARLPFIGKPKTSAIVTTVVTSSQPRAKSY